MTPTSFCIVTPSHAEDFQRCRLLSRTLQLVTPPSPHYIVVDRRDVMAFRCLRGHNTDIIAVEDVLPRWIARLASFAGRSIWLSSRTLPIRGWLLQQIVKLAVAERVRHECLLYVDSDVFFVRPFDFKALFLNDQLMLHRRSHTIQFGMGLHYKWVQVAERLLCLPTTTFPAHNYIDSVVPWRRKNVLGLCELIERNWGCHWIEAIANSWNCAEYILYGMFCEGVLESQAGHFYTEKRLCHNYWGSSPMKDHELVEFFRRIGPERVAMMISAKSGMPVERYEKLIPADFTK